MPVVGTTVQQNKTENRQPKIKCINYYKSLLKQYFDCSCSKVANISLHQENGTKETGKKGGKGEEKTVLRPDIQFGQESWLNPEFPIGMRNKKVSIISLFLKSEVQHCCLAKSLENDAIHQNTVLQLFSAFNPKAKG